MKSTKMLDERLLVLLLDSWIYNLEKKANREIDKKVTVRRNFILHNGFSKTTVYQMKDMAKGDLVEIMRLFRMKLPDTQPVMVMQEPQDFMSVTPKNLEFYLDHSFIKETKTKIELDLIYKQEY